MTAARRRAIAVLAAVLTIVGLVWLWRWTDPNEQAFRELDRIGLHREFDLVDEDPAASRFLCIDACGSTLRIYRTSLSVQRASDLATDRLERAGYAVSDETEPGAVAAARVGASAGGPASRRKTSRRARVVERKDGTVVYAVVLP